MTNASANVRIKMLMHGKCLKCARKRSKILINLYKYCNSANAETKYLKMQFLALVAYCIISQTCADGLASDQYRRIVH